MSSHDRPLLLENSTRTFATPRATKRVVAVLPAHSVSPVVGAVTVMRGVSRTIGVENPPGVAYDVGFVLTPFQMPSLDVTAYTTAFVR